LAVLAALALNGLLTQRWQDQVVYFLLTHPRKPRRWNPAGLFLSVGSAGRARLNTKPAILAGFFFCIPVQIRTRELRRINRNS
jgi:hypothetical protein